MKKSKIRWIYKSFWKKIFFFSFLFQRCKLVLSVRPSFFVPHWVIAYFLKYGILYFCCPPFILSTVSQIFYPLLVLSSFIPDSSFIFYSFFFLPTFLSLFSSSSLPLFSLTFVPTFSSSLSFFSFSFSLSLSSFFSIPEHHLLSYCTYRIIRTWALPIIESNSATSETSCSDNPVRTIW